MSVALKRVSSLTGGKTIVGWQPSTKNANGNMCSTIGGQAIETGIDQISGNVYVRFAASVAGVIYGTTAYTDPVTITTISTTLIASATASISLIDNKLYLVVTHFDVGENRFICSLWRDDTGLGSGFTYVSKIANCANAGVTSVIIRSPGCSPIIKLANGNLACGANVYQSAALGYWRLYVTVSSDGGATWSAPVGGSNGSWTAGEYASRTIWEIYPGIIMGNTTGTSTGYIAMWSSSGAVYEGAAIPFSGGTITMGGIAFFTTNDSTIYIMVDGYSLRSYKGPLPPSLSSLSDINNWTLENNYLSSNLGRSAINDPVGKILWCFNIDKYGAVFPGILKERVRNTRHLVDETWVQSKKGRYMASEGVWKRVIV